MQLTAARLREVLAYDQETGTFTWRTRRGSRAAAGDVAGHVDVSGYVSIRVDGVSYWAHRLAWLYVTGALPEQHVDHFDQNKANNRFVNLRDVSRSMNLQNQRRPHRTNTTGFLGVIKPANSPRFSAQIKVNGVRKYLGMYDTPELAHAAYVSAKRLFHVGCTL